MNPYPNLLSPKKVGSILFKNRIFTAPTGAHAPQYGTGLSGIDHHALCKPGQGWPRHGHIMLRCFDRNLRVHLCLRFSKTGIVRIEHLENDPVACLQPGILAINWEAGTGHTCCPPGTNSRILSTQRSVHIDAASSTPSAVA